MSKQRRPQQWRRNWKTHVSLVRDLKRITHVTSPTRNSSWCFCVYGSGGIGVRHFFRLLPKMTLTAHHAPISHAPDSGLQVLCVSCRFFRAYEPAIIQRCFALSRRSFSGASRAHFRVLGLLGIGVPRPLWDSFGTLV